MHTFMWLFSVSAGLLWLRTGRGSYSILII